MDIFADFDSTMDAQLAFVTELIHSLTEEDLATEVDLFGMGNAMPISSYLYDVLLKNYPAYRMQLFQYMKAGLGMTELNTMNLRMGIDAPMGG